MAWEVEIKGWVRNPKETEALLRNRATYGGSLYKEDVYFRGPSRSFRLRKEGDEYRVTVKEKQVIDGGEVNREIEFTVDSAPAFTAFAGAVGCPEEYRKVKRGHRFTWDRALLELCEVEGLGWFLEIEEVHPDEGRQNPGVLQEASARVKNLLLEAGIAEEDIEPRFYSELLKEARQ